MTVHDHDRDGDRDGDRDRCDPPVVYVITDMDQPTTAPTSTAPAASPAAGTGDGDPYAALWAALQPVMAMTAVAASLLGVTALAFGLLLGWPPAVLGVAAVLALPALVVLVDLAGARAGWPPLAWTAARIVASHRSRKESPRG
ncbi:hypothetical protein Ssi03_76860 [Sphaerisporangium siamense]|uniref:Uncharacterized protein n=1 Tax=Sphaerisporangium siamense TaxID=795645 RepID=A0A7W7DG53_9ACTN|nr:hypothetical protein [Sphaerisporangium siamense]MBB4706172.1 hypothetical protein [Sphaerisporangium siamense]GII89696.1 hypothetical protein Ssi03_76860 [Sphaerisporangium siamense]